MFSSSTSNFILHKDQNDDYNIFHSSHNRALFMFMPGHYYDLNLKLNSFVQISGLGGKMDDVLLHGQSIEHGGNNCLWVTMENLKFKGEEALGQSHMKHSGTNPMRRIVDASSITHPPSTREKSFLSTTSLLGDNYKLPTHIKPYLIMKTETGKFSMMVPKLELTKKSDSMPEEEDKMKDEEVKEQEITFETVFVAEPQLIETSSSQVYDDKATTMIQHALDNNLHVVFTPGVYKLSHTLNVKHNNQVLLGLGYATLTCPHGNDPCISVQPSTKGVRISSLIIMKTNKSQHNGRKYNGATTRMEEVNTDVYDVELNQANKDQKKIPITEEELKVHTPVLQPIHSVKKKASTKFNFAVKTATSTTVKTMVMESATSTTQKKLPSTTSSSSSTSSSDSSLLSEEVPSSVFVKTNVLKVPTTHSFGSSDNCLLSLGNEDEVDDDDDEVKGKTTLLTDLVMYRDDDDTPTSKQHQMVCIHSNDVVLDNIWMKSAKPSSLLKDAGIKITSKKNVLIYDLTSENINKPTNRLSDCSSSPSVYSFAFSSSYSNQQSNECTDSN